MLCVKHFIDVKRPYIRCFMNGEDMRDLQERDNLQQLKSEFSGTEFGWLMTNAGSLGKKDVKRKKWDLVRAAGDNLFVQSVSKWESFLERAEPIMWGVGPDMYALLILEPPHSLHLGVPKLSVDVMLGYMPSEMIVTKWWSRRSNRMTLVQENKSVLHSWNTYLSIE